MTKPDKVLVMQPRAVRFPKPLWKQLRLVAELRSEDEGRRITVAEIIRRGAMREVAILAGTP